MSETFEKLSFVRFVDAKVDGVHAFQNRERAYLDIAYCISGEMTYFFNGERITLETGDAVIFPPYSARVREKGIIPTHYVSLNVVLPDGYGVDAMGLFKKCITPDTVYMIDLFGKVWSSVTPGRIERCKGIFHYLYNELLDSISDKGNPHVSRIKQYIMDNLSRKMSIKEIADMCNMSVGYFERLFKEYAGVTPTLYRIQKKMQRAKLLLSNETLNIDQIAFQLGFEDTAYFCRVFKKQNGCTPTEYRQK